MDAKVVFVIVCLCTLALTSTEAGITNCCIKLRTHVKPGILNKVHRWEMQEINDRCEVRALLLYVKGLKKPICGHPSMKKPLKPKKKNGLL